MLLFHSFFDFRNLAMQLKRAKNHEFSLQSKKFKPLHSNNYSKITNNGFCRQYGNSRNLILMRIFGRIFFYLSFQQKEV